jgi:P-aminobenzoate N-oxygenase AurF
MMYGPSSSPGSTGDSVDFSRPFIPEQFTPLYHTGAWAGLTTEQRRRYNQLYALYFNEQIIFFETSLSESVLLPLASSGVPAPLAAALRQFVEEERRHTRMFRALNRACAPALYELSDFYFIRVPAGYARLLHWVARRVRYFPMILWLMLLQEERSLFYSRTILRCRHELEPAFVDVHRAHMKDEVGHVGWDEELLDELWEACGPALRRLNAELFRWMVGEFFNTPKRGGLRVVSHFAREFRELTPRATTLRAAVLDLARSPEYHRSLYSREMVPRTFARFDRFPEFSSLGRTLYGYQRAHDQAAPHRHH